MKVMLVYLDIDGVLIPDGYDPSIIPATFAKRLRAVLEATDAHIVATSARRRSPDTLLMLLATAGFEPIDLHRGPGGWTTNLFLTSLDDNLSIRGQEIADHVLRAQPQSYVILDDCPVLADQAHRHVQPDARVGLTDVDIAAAIAILRSPSHAF